MEETKQQVRTFYDQVGWKQVSENVYQNARYEDLRPVSREYIHRCHLRVSQHITKSGNYLLDAGSGPIQYPEYLEYSQGYQYRVCADISITALIEARSRIGAHGLFVVCDVARLPFKPESFDGIVSLHTLHHLSDQEQEKAYLELHRVLAPEHTGVVVNGWGSSKMMDFFDPFIRFGNRIRSIGSRLSGKRTRKATKARRSTSEDEAPKGTFSRHTDYEWFKITIAPLIPLEVWVWRSVSVRFLRALIHPWLGGRYWLRILFLLENRYPNTFGEKGVYPLIVIRKF